MEAVENLCLGPKHSNIGTAITIKLHVYLFCRILGRIYDIHIDKKYIWSVKMLISLDMNMNSDLCFVYRSGRNDDNSEACLSGSWNFDKYIQKQLFT